ncbi:hypothetical protein ACOSP7_029483 [Xanthoceras sorbifolium]
MPNPLKDTCKREDSSTNIGNLLVFGVRPISDPVSSCPFSSLYCLGYYKLSWRCERDQVGFLILEVSKSTL